MQYDSNPTFTNNTIGSSYMTPIAMSFDSNPTFSNNEFSFMDNQYDQMYKAEIRSGKIFGYFVFLAIFISCLGLFGLSSYTTVQRTKEIGIRKVLGSSNQGIVTLPKFNNAITSDALMSSLNTILCFIFILLLIINRIDYECGSLGRNHIRVAYKIYQKF